MKSARILSSSLLHNSRATCSNGIALLGVVRPFSKDTAEIHVTNKKSFMTSTSFNQEHVSIPKVFEFI